MTIRRLSREEARRIAVRAQMLDTKRPGDLLTVAEQLTFLQLDPTAVVAPSADLVAWSRIGSAYQPADLQTALESDRTMFEHRSQDPPNTPFIAMVRPMSNLALFLAEMEELRRTPGQVNDWLAANRRFRRRVLDRLRAEGPLASRDIPDTADMPWKSTGWTHGRNVNQMLEFLASRAVVAVSGRIGKERLWDLAERVYPADVHAVPAPQARRTRDEKRLRSLGVARPRFVGDAGIPVEVEGTAGEWRLDPEATAEGFNGRTALLSPFDRLIHDYNRVRARDLFDFKFILEFYKPRDQRRWGYFAMPVLHHSLMVGKVDVSADRDASRLVVNAVHEDVRWTKAIKSAVEAELEALASWLGLDGGRLG